MSILFDSARPVNARSRTFAAGLSFARHKPYSTDDVAWWAAEGNRDARDYDVIGPADSVLDLAAGVAMAQSLLDSGLGLS